MEERVKQFLDKEHSKRFRTMCHRNETIAAESKVRLDFYENEKKKSIHKLDIASEELHKRMLKYSQEKLVNELLNKLTDLAFQDGDSSRIDNTLVNINRVESAASTIQGEAACPRYLRMETNLFHPSVMSLDSSDSYTSSSSEEEKTNENEKREEEEDSSSPNISPSNTEAKIKNVVEKLTGLYNIDRLKSLTQILVKSLQSTNRARYEDKMKLIYNLSKYLNQEDDTEDTEKCKSVVKPDIKPTGNSMFLFLKSDRRSELIKEAERKEKVKERELELRGRSESRLAGNKFSACKGTNLSEKARIRRLSLPLMAQKEGLNLEDGKRFPTSEEALAKIIDYGPSHDDTHDLMKSIYLKLGHEALLKLPRYSRQMVISKQKAWLRRDLKKFPIFPVDGSHDLRVVMKNCRYLRFPKDMDHENL